jgi:hypothetical protein
VRRTRCDPIVLLQLPTCNIPVQGPWCLTASPMCVSNEIKVRSREVSIDIHSERCYPMGRASRCLLALEMRFFTLYGQRRLSLPFRYLEFRGVRQETFDRGVTFRVDLSEEPQISTRGRQWAQLISCCSGSFPISTSQCSPRGVLQWHVRV